MSQQFMPQARGQNAPVSVENQIQQMRGEFARAIGGATPAVQQERAERFARVCITAFRQNAELQKCSPASILGAMLTCAQLGLEPNTPVGQAYLIPRWNSKLRSMECQFQLGYRGVLELLYRSGAIASFNADVVYRGELERGLFRYTSGIHPNIEHTIDLLDNSARTGNPADIVAAYACVTLKSGEPVMRLVTRKEIDAAMAVSGGKSGPSAVWKSHYPAMAIKTAIHRLSKWLPSSKIDEAFEAEARYIEAEAKPAEPVQAGLSLEAMNAMMQAGQGVVAEAPEAPAVEQAVIEPEPAPQPEPVQAPAPEPAPAQEERPMAFRPAEPQNVDSVWEDYFADHNGDGEAEARAACWADVQDGKYPDMTAAKAAWLAEAQKMDGAAF